VARIEEWGTQERLAYLRVASHVRSGLHRNPTNIAGLLLRERERDWEITTIVVTLPLVRELGVTPLILRRDGSTAVCRHVVKQVVRRVRER